MKHTVDKNFFPGWTRKAVTFTIDDGHIESDEIFLSYVRPAGIKGTFNLCGNRLLDKKSAEEWREFYAGYGIANHCSYHPFCMSDEVEYAIADEPFDPEKADPEKIYRHASVDGLYHHMRSTGWRLIASFETYIRLIDESKEILESIFGEGEGRSFVIPFIRTDSAQFENWTRTSGVRSVRGKLVGGTDGADDFSLPKDRLAWSYNAAHNTLKTQSERFAAYPDDGALHWLCIGVHSIDYERSERWQDLKACCDLLGNRPESYYSAPVDTIFDYEDAIASLVVTDDEIVNPSSLDLCVTVDGERKTVSRNSTLKL